jgi:hypothetical protein
MSRARLLFGAAAASAALTLSGTGIALADQPADQGNPNYFTTPAANSAAPGDNNPPAQQCTYKAPPAAYGPSAAPGSNAAGGSPGYVTVQCFPTGVPQQ